MAKIMRPILEYRDIIRQAGITIDDTTPPKRVLRRFVHYLKEIPDTRMAGMIEYPLCEILLIAFLAVLGNASSWCEMEDFENQKQRWLRKFLPLKNGIPSHDTFRRVFGLLSIPAFEAATVSFVSENMGSLRRSLGPDAKRPGQICVDGKEQRGSGRSLSGGDTIKNLQTLHIYDASNGICLVSAPIEEKTNEIPVAQLYLSRMELADAIVTFDAMNLQKKTIAVIKEQKGHYVGSLKGNHDLFFDDVSTYFTEERLHKIREKGVNFLETIEKSHSQVETRRFYLSSSISWFADKDLWKGLRSFICYEKTVCHLHSGKETKEVRYYITDLKDIELCAEAIRGHWSVENQLHWNLDRNFGEDDNSTMDRNAFNNLSVLNKMVLSLMKLVQPLQRHPLGIKSLRKSFGWATEDGLARLLNSFDEKVIIEAMETANAKK